MVLNIEDMEEIYGPKPVSNHAKKTLYLLVFEIVGNRKRLLVMI